MYLNMYPREIYIFHILRSKLARNVNLFIKLVAEIDKNCVIQVVQEN